MWSVGIPHKRRISLTQYVKSSEDLYVVPDWTTPALDQLDHGVRSIVVHPFIPSLKAAASRISLLRGRRVSEDSHVDELFLPPKLGFRFVLVVIFIFLGLIKLYSWQ